MHDHTERALLRDCPAIRIPSGEPLLLPQGTRVIITQALGGSYTVATESGLARVADEHADALRLEPALPPPPEFPPCAPGENVSVSDARVWDQLRTCYDPEIALNI